MQHVLISHCNTKASVFSLIPVGSSYKNSSLQCTGYLLPADQESDKNS